MSDSDGLFESGSYKSDSDCDSLDDSVHQNGLHVGFPSQRILSHTNSDQPFDTTSKSTLGDHHHHDHHDDHSTSQSSDQTTGTQTSRSDLISDINKRSHKHNNKHKHKEYDKVSFLLPNTPITTTPIEGSLQTSETKSNSDDDMDHDQASVQGSVYSKYSKASFTSRISSRRKQKPWEPQFNRKHTSVAHLGHHNHPWEGADDTATNKHATRHKHTQSLQPIQQQQQSQQQQHTNYEIGYNDDNDRTYPKPTQNSRKQGQEFHSGVGFSFRQKDSHHGLLAKKKEEDRPVAPPSALALVGNILGYATDLTQSDDDSVSVFQMYRSQSDDDMETASKAATVATFGQMFRLEEEEIEDTMEDRNIKEGIELSRKTHSIKVKTKYDVDTPPPRTLVRDPSIKNGLLFMKEQNWRLPKPGQELVESSEDDNISHPCLDPLDELLHPDLILMRNSQASLNTLARETLESSQLIDPNYVSKNLDESNSQFLDPQKAMDDLEELSVAEQVIAKFESIDHADQVQDIDYYRKLAGLEEESLPSLETATMSLQSLSDADEEKEALREFMQEWLNKIEIARVSRERTLLDMFRWTLRHDTDHQERLRYLGQSMHKSIAMKKMMSLDASKRLEFEMNEEKKRKNSNVADTEFVWPEDLRIKIEPSTKQERKAGVNIKQKGKREINVLFKKKQKAAKEGTSNQKRDIVLSTNVSTISDSSGNGTEFLLYEAGIADESDLERYEERLSESSSSEDDISISKLETEHHKGKYDTDASSVFLLYEAGVDSASDRDDYIHRLSDSSDSEGTPKGRDDENGPSDTEVLTSPKSPSEEFNNEALALKTRPMKKSQVIRDIASENESSGESSEHLYFEQGIDSSSASEYKSRVSESSSSGSSELGVSIAKNEKPEITKNAIQQALIGSSNSILNPPVQYVTTDDEWMDESTHTVSDDTDHLYFEAGIETSDPETMHIERTSEGEGEDEDGQWEFLGLIPPPEVIPSALQPPEEEKTEEVSQIDKHDATIPMITANRKPPKPAKKTKNGKKAKGDKKEKRAPGGSVAERGYSNGSLHLYYILGLSSDPEGRIAKEGQTELNDKKKKAKAEKKKAKSNNGKIGPSEKFMENSTETVDKTAARQKKDAKKVSTNKKKSGSKGQTKSNESKVATELSRQGDEAEIKSLSKEGKGSIKESKNTRRARRASKLSSKGEGRSETDDEDSIVVMPPVFRKAPSRPVSEKKGTTKRKETKKKSKKKAKP